MALDYSDRLTRITRLQDIPDHARIILSTNEDLNQAVLFDIGAGFVDLLAYTKQEAIDMHADGKDAILTIGALQQIASDYHITGSASGAGPQGGQGPQGPAGDSTGMGPQGDIGPQGTQGVWGDMGMGGQGDKGLQGETGLKGADCPGPQGDCKGEQEANHNNPDAGHDINGQWYVTAIGIQGPQGPLGEISSNQIQGFRGYAGSQTLVQGPSGAYWTGMQGSIGPQGTSFIDLPTYVGPGGLQGPEGYAIQGPTGSHYEYYGYPGPEGDPGLQGPDADNPTQAQLDAVKGVQGLQGLVGNTGENGNIGDDGESGDNFNLAGNIANLAEYKDKIRDSFHRLGIEIGDHIIRIVVDD